MTLKTVLSSIYRHAHMLPHPCDPPYPARTHIRRCPYISRGRCQPLCAEGGVRGWGSISLFSMRTLITVLTCSPGVEIPHLDGWTKPPASLGYLLLPTVRQKPGSPGLCPAAPRMVQAKTVCATESTTLESLSRVRFESYPWD